MMTETMQSTEALKARPTGPKMQTTANEIAVDIVAMHKWYGDFHVLRDINLRVKRGERIIISGPSGSGKSTMIRCINRLEEHQQGRIVVDGVELTVSSTPSTTMRPCWCSSSRLMQRIMVDLPDPDGPLMMMRSPRFTLRFMSRRTWKSPYHLCIATISTAISLAVVCIFGPVGRAFGASVDCMVSVIIASDQQVSAGRSWPGAPRCIWRSAPSCNRT